MCYCTLNKFSRKQVTYFILPNVIQSKYSIHPRIKKNQVQTNFGFFFLLALQPTVGLYFTAL